VTIARVCAEEKLSVEASTAVERIIFITGDGDIPMTVRATPRLFSCRIVNSTEGSISRGL
jgi:hypothetical protein